MNLTSALGSMQIYFKGTEHGALADARNTAGILQQLSHVQAVRQQIEHRTLHTTAQSPMDSLWGWFSRTAERKKAETPDVVSLP